MGSTEWRDEANADVASLLDDYKSARSQIARAPEEIRDVVRDMIRDAHSLSADLRVEAEHTRESMARMFRHTNDDVTSNQTPQNQR